ncbi:hypothetical protein BC777_0091 [Yoonia maricola]|uniref:Uncharacterized protein n=1 Tax=Yoonia maricola TaxID=420999 RepID=A0A2M8WK19_9RHOB|nr:hypothetical protein [Yoonia maricola]PJI91267.1 hypothetical protein BC777_0091 [Yoonia maricola]
MGQQPAPFNIMIVGQGGRLEYEALLFTASLRAYSPQFSGQLYIAEPQPGPLWDRDPRMSSPVKDHLAAMGAQVVPFETRHFGSSYPQGNKIEGLQVLPANQPFIFFDTDTMITGELTDIPFNFDRPAASMRRGPTWPVEELYWPGYTAIWKSLYDRFGLAFESSLDLSQPDEYWERYLYFNAGWFYGADPAAFGARYTEYATTIRDNPPDELVIQPLDPWLDQVALPLVIHGLGGGRPGPAVRGLDGHISYHYRMLPLFYATASDAQVAMLEDVTAPNKLKKLLKLHEPFKRMVYQKRGHKVRALFDRNNLPRHERAIRNQIKSAGFWMR